MKGTCRKRSSLVRQRLCEARSQETGFGLVDIIVAIIILIIASASFAATSITIGNSAASIRASSLAVTTNNSVLSNASAFGCGMVTGTEPIFNVTLKKRKAVCGGLGSYVLSNNVEGISLSANSSVLYNSSYATARGTIAYLHGTNFYCVPYNLSLTMLHQQASLTYKGKTGKTQTATSYATQSVPTDSPLFHLPLTSQGGISVMITSSFPSSYYFSNPSYSFYNTETHLISKTSEAKHPTTPPVYRAQDANGCIIMPFLPLGNKTMTSTTSQWTIYMTQDSKTTPVGTFTLNTAGSAPQVGFLSNGCSVQGIRTVPAHTPNPSTEYKVIQEKCTFASSAKATGGRINIVAYITAWVPAA